MLRRERHYGDRVVACFPERPPTLAAMLAAAAGTRPDGEALVCGACRLTWRRLDERARRFAAGLQARGVRPGDRVALLLGNDEAFVIATLGAALAGGIVVPLNVREQAPGIAFILAQCGARAVVHDAALAERLPPDGPLRIGAGSAVHGSEPFGSVESAAPLEAAHDAGEDDVAAILYTSGTTGRPKGAMLTHLGIVHSATVYARQFDLGPDDRLGAVVPLSHVTGLVALFAVALRTAGTLVVVPGFKAAEFLPLAARERMTFTVMVPAMYSLCLLQPDFDAHDLGAWRVGAYGGAPMAPAVVDELARRLPRLALANCYGATETTSPMTVMPPALTRAHPDSVGLPVPGAEICVMDDDGREVPRGQTGELWHRGPMVVPGYWDNPQADAENFVAGFWRSGDVGSIDDQGCVRVLDRRKDMLMRGGYKVYSVEVENVLCQHSQVLEAAVVGRPDDVLGERVHAFVTARDAAMPDAHALRRFCAERLADYKVPETYTVDTAPLPRNANGKLLKRELRERAMRERP
jgi:acyl-CoA synthetase (AMP-forming)/AMP-acid ligase II